MKKENIFQMVWSRFKQLICKLLSVKGMFALTATYSYFGNPTIETTIVFVASWGLLIGLREYEKLKEILPTWKGNGTSPSE
jgi:hypothetical protein